MYKLDQIDLGNDEAEQDTRLEEYFVRTQFYENALSGNKTLVIGRKGSGKSAIFILISKEIQRNGNMVIPITPDQYSWSALKDYRESGILPEQANTNAWRLTLLSAMVWKFNDEKLLDDRSKLTSYYKYMNDAYIPKGNTWFLNIVQKGKKLLSGIRTHWVSFDFGETSTISTPIRIIDETQALLQKEWPNGKIVRILIDRLDDSWDASQESIHTLIGLLKAANLINTAFSGKVIVTIFLRSDIYDNLFFDDQDKLRQHEELILWKQEDLKAVVTERIRISLKLPLNISSIKIWNKLFSRKVYRSKASADKYIIDRTFKRPRDMISFVRFALEQAIKNQRSVIEPEDTRLAEEEKYSQSKFKDIVIENQKQYPYVKDLLDNLSGSLHKISSKDIRDRIATFIDQHQLKLEINMILRLLFMWGVIGIKKQGRAGVTTRSMKQVDFIHIYRYIYA